MGRACSRLKIPGLLDGAGQLLDLKNGYNTTQFFHLQDEFFLAVGGLIQLGFTRHGNYCFSRDQTISDAAEAALRDDEFRLPDFLFNARLFEKSLERCVLRDVVRMTQLDKKFLTRCQGALID